MKIDSRLKKTLEITFTILLIIFVIVAVYEAARIRVRTEETVLTSYELIQDSRYTVNIKNNPYVNEEFSNRNNKYIHALVENIEVYPGVVLRADEAVKTEGHYSVYVRNYTYQNTSDTGDYVWDNIEVIHKDIPVNSRKAALEIRNKINISPGKYEEKIMRAKNELGVGLSGIVEVYIEGEIQVSFRNQTKKLRIYSGISIPLNMTRFEITNLADKVEQGDFTEINEVKYRVGLKSIALYLIFSVVCMAGLLFVIFGTQERSMKDIRKCRIRKILNKGRGRLIRLEKMPDVFIVENYQVASLEQLIRMSEEMVKPVFYVWDSENIVFDNQIFMVDGNNKYTYRIKEVD